jgi:hypothetical protein
MSKSLKIFLITTTVLVVGIVLFFYIGFAGLPWKKWTVGNQILSYLEEKYEEDFQIEERYYNFKDSSYGIKVYPTKKPDLVFNAAEGWGNHEFIDFYPESIWEKQADADFRDIVKEIYPTLRNFRAGTVYGEGVELVQGPQIPSYLEAKAFVDVAVMIPEKFRESDEDFEKMLKLVEYANQKGGNIHIFIVYEPTEDDSKDTFYINFTNEEIKKIHTIDDVKKYYNNLE